MGRGTSATYIQLGRGNKERNPFARYPALPAQRYQPETFDSQSKSKFMATTKSMQSSTVVAP